jgi:ATP-dependent RNA helicase DDX3X
MLENVKLCQYTVPTPIQSYCIPAVLTGHDVVAVAQTGEWFQSKTVENALLTCMSGSGKTAAFLIPILSKLMGKARQLAAPRPNPARYNPLTDRVRAEPLVLVVCPTRELACQIFDEARRLCYRTMLRPCVVYGGAPTKNQREQLEMGCDVLIATPGRLMDFMSHNNLLSLRRLKYVNPPRVYSLIEATDIMTGSLSSMRPMSSFPLAGRRLWGSCSRVVVVVCSLFTLFSLHLLILSTDVNTDGDHTYMMFSATFPKGARRLAKEYMENECIRVKVGRVGSTHENIKQQIIYVNENEKNQALFDLIFSDGPQRILVFTNSKVKCDMVDDFLYNKGLPVTSIHSDRTQREREDAL